MRKLKFIVSGQIIKPDPNCDFSNIVPGTSEYLQLEFDFSKEWDGTIRVVGFYSIFGSEYEPCFLEEGVRCMVPTEAAAKQSFIIRVFGKRDSYTINTNKITITQDGGRL